MRIIAGSLRGQKILRPKNLTTRPTTDRVREALYALVESRMSLRDANLMDLFSGTGALAFEGMSRGANSAILVESDRRAVNAARKNAEHLNLSHKCQYLCADAITFLKCYQGPPMNLILADPPYEIEALPDLPDLALRCLSPGGLFVVEHDSRIKFSGHPSLNTSRGYGRTHVSIFID